jgi:hypothetical protein
MHIPALEVRFPKHEGKTSDADEHNGYLKKYCRATFHGSMYGRRGRRNPVKPQTCERQTLCRGVVGDELLRDIGRHLRMKLASVQ